jgi:3-dehydrosphinganine reductase
MTPLHAIISGGSSGIGLALARKLGASGHNLSLIARRESVLKEAASEIERHFVRSDQRVVIRAADVADAKAAEAAVAAAIAELGAPDLVVTSAGIAIPGYFEEVPTAVYERTMAVNYFGTLYVLRAALPSMRARRQGRVVMISSGAALTGIFGYAAYGPSKFAVRGLAETLVAELTSDNVGVSIAYPPDTHTPQLEEEEKTKPEETKLITSVAATWSADAVADAILAGIERGAFVITPGATLTLMRFMPGLVIPALRWYCDRLVARVRRKRLRDGTKPLRAVFSAVDGDSRHAG